MVNSIKTQKWDIKKDIILVYNMRKWTHFIIFFFCVWKILDEENSTVSDEQNSNKLESNIAQRVLGWVNQVLEST